MVVFWRSGLGLSFFLLIGAVVFFGSPGGWRRVVLKPFLYLGDISYGVYLWHVPVIIALKSSGIVTPFRFTWLVLVCVVLLAAASWHLIERPVISRYR
jgi:peptidoglycan/LPS O-acetylase OafA/YrhL